MSNNVPASVRQRLTNRAKATDRPFQELLQYFAMERFRYRRMRSRHASLRKTCRDELAKSLQSVNEELVPFSCCLYTSQLQFHQVWTP